MEESIFLTYDQAREAVCIDFEQYGPQPDQLRRVLEILGVDHPIPEAEPMGGVVRSVFALRPPDRDQLVQICEEVFWTRVELACNAEWEAGLLIPTDMDRFHCTRCGMCCQALDFHRECSPRDVVLWEEHGRSDILEWVGRDQDGGYRIWVRPGTDLMAEACPWLVQELGGRWTCSIHDFKPEICREYPGSRKHAHKTGCPTARARCGLHVQE